MTEKEIIARQPASDCYSITFKQGWLSFNDIAMITYI